MIQQAPLLSPTNGRDLIVWRRVSSDVHDENASELQCDGFLSTTIDPCYMADVSPKSNYTVLKIRISSPTPALWIPGFESEILFDHGHSLTVISKSKQTFIHREETRRHTVLECVINPVKY
jgi:hypothetical protein